MEGEINVLSADTPPPKLLFSEVGTSLNELSFCEKRK